MNTEQIINYVTETPTNTNKAVLKSMLESSGESNGDFSIVNVKVDYRIAAEINGVFLDNENPDIFATHQISMSPGINEYQAVLYKGAAHLGVNSFFGSKISKITITGDVVDITPPDSHPSNGGGTFEITGNCEFIIFPGT